MSELLSPWRFRFDCATQTEINSLQAELERAIEFRRGLGKRKYNQYFCLELLSCAARGRDEKKYLEDAFRLAMPDLVEFRVERSARSFDWTVNGRVAGWMPKKGKSK